MADSLLLTLSIGSDWTSDMGLDAVEIVLDIEEEFGIKIDDDEVWYFATLGNVHDYLLEKCGVRKRVDCPGRTVFYRLRQAMGTVLDVEPKGLRPNTAVLPLLGRWRRRRTWKQIERELGMTLPKLKDGTDVGVLWGAIIAGSIGFLAMSVLSLDPWVGFTFALLAMIPGMLIGFVVGALCLPPTVELRDRTVGGLARRVAMINHDQLRLDPEPDPENDPIWERLCKVVVRQLGVKREVLKRGTRFSEDLGI